MLNELDKLLKLINREDFLKNNIRAYSAAELKKDGKTYPIYSFSIGSSDPTCPVLFITGGIHGLERIGTQLAWSLLKTTLDRLLWDESLRFLFGKIRLVVLPLLNPYGYENYRRSNINGVDLMRNSPIEAQDEVPFLLGGHRYTSRLPWFRGIEGQLEPENKVLFDIYKNEVALSSCAVAVDFHSGFGMKDRLWFPYSNTHKPFENLAEMQALTHLFEQTHPYHIYQIEPQSKGYLLSGDMWDYLYLDFINHNKTGVFLPITLEMGSWTWVRKNPLQIFSKHGAFNPIKEHRIKRTYRRHHLLFDFLLKAVFSNNYWSCLDPLLKEKYHHSGLDRWYKS